MQFNIRLLRGCDAVWNNETTQNLYSKCRLWQWSLSFTSWEPHSQDISSARLQQGRGFFFLSSLTPDVHKQVSDSCCHPSMKKKREEPLSHLREWGNAKCQRTSGSWLCLQLNSTCPFLIYSPPSVSSGLNKDLGSPQRCTLFSQNPIKKIKNEQQSSNTEQDLHK